MAKRKMQKTAKRRLALFGPIAIFIIGYFIFTVISIGYDLYTLNAQKSTLHSDYKNLQSNASDLKTEITKLQDKDYVARYARENYLYTKNGEYVIKESDTEDNTKQAKQKIPLTEEEMAYIGIGIGIFLIIIILYKHKKKKKARK